MRAALIFTTGVALAACSPVPPAAPAPDTVRTETTTEVTTQVESGPIGGDMGNIRKAIENAQRAVGLRATSDTVRLRIGETVTFGSLPLTMVDAEGRDLGPLPIYDQRLSGGQATEFVNKGIRGANVGVQSITFSIPRPFQSGRDTPAPGATLHFVVQR